VFVDSLSMCSENSSYAFNDAVLSANALHFVAVALCV